MLELRRRAERRHVPISDILTSQTFSLSQLHHPWLGESIDARCLGTVRTTKSEPRDFNTVTDDSTSTMVAQWRESVDCTLETIEMMTDLISPHFEGLIKTVPAHFTAWHDRSLVEI